ncbi:uncharacterized protein LAESUDRAFT_718777 [Laetiporus sulphureus 93-53]|uniref:CID domain-containing protein n=1 Tax=Laetiporus sulphureus 93-53 TaxID=1314785 RepID=A0A165I2T6_9APHY|nr:uncharacterized protein LAESUDRAFT_718777 [Laetiporus sulphureus 93-53]KZT12516.1 hypothetical protein LAESUDRAFT_718777 [Laetiporus sulphureus 93-53]
MSLYPPPQSQPFGQMPYPAPGYGQPMAAYSYPPPVQPVYHVDPNIFRRDYMARLAELTINSRPIIQNLSMIAQDYSRFADIVVQCIETHIRRVLPSMKLPAFYLLDAISKNVYEPYARHFTPIVVKLFLDTYEQVDQTTRSKMEEMLLTWRTGAPNGRELFGVVPQVAIERQIWGGESTQNASTNRHFQGVASISTAQVLSELEFVLNQKERATQSNPYDKVAQNHVVILQQLRKLVQAGVSQDELGQILNQLRTLAQPTTAPTPQLPPAPSPQVYAAQPSYPASIPAPQMPSFPPAIEQAPYQQQTSYAGSTYGFPKAEPVDLQSMLAPQPSRVPPPTSTSVPAPTGTPVNNIASLYNALLKAGVVSATGTPTGAGATAKSEEKSLSSDPIKDAAREYRKAVFSHKIKLTSAGISKRRSHIVQLLYQRLPVQCKQCGIRFPDGTEGKKKMEDHLDMHFRQNRRASQAVGRGHSRSWFVSVEDWIHDGAIDIKGKSRAGGRTSSNSAAAAAEVAKREAELRALFVVVPPGDEAKSIFCPICKELLKSEFLEDDEEWVWRNAVKRDDKIYHATCHAEATANKSTLAIRLRNEVSRSRSRSHTPEKSVRSPPLLPLPLNGEAKKSVSPPPTGTKRKAEAEDATPAEGKGDTPPTKKLAV